MMEEGETLARLGLTWWARGWLGPWVALAGLINAGMEEGVLDRPGLTLVGYRDWLGPWVALAGLINEGTEEDEVGVSGADPETKALYYLSSRYIEPKIRGVPVSDVFSFAIPNTGFCISLAECFLRSLSYTHVSACFASMTCIFWVSKISVKAQLSPFFDDKCLCGRLF